MSLDMIVLILIIFGGICGGLESLSENDWRKIFGFISFPFKLIFKYATNLDSSQKAFEPLFEKIQENSIKSNVIDVPENKNFNGTLYECCDLLKRDYNKILKNTGDNNYIDLYSAPNYKMSVNVPFDINYYNKVAKKLNEKDIQYINKYMSISFEDIPYMYNQSQNQGDLLIDEFSLLSKDVATYNKGKLGRDNLKKALKENTSYRNAMVDITLKATGELIENNAVIITEKGVFIVELKNYGNSDDTLTVSKEGTWTLKHKKDAPVIINDMAQLNNKRCAITQTVINDKLKEKGITGIPFLDCISIICIANDDVRIMNNSNHIVCRTSNLIKTIEKYKPEDDFRLSVRLQEEIANILVQENLPSIKYNIVNRNNKIETLNSNLNNLNDNLSNCFEIIENYSKLLIK